MVHYLRSGIFLLLSVCLIHSALAAPAKAGKAPNVIYILVDDMGYSDLGCYGGEIETPNIDSLAKAGVKFRHFYNASKCETSRTALMSGLYHGRGYNATGGATLAEAVKSAGYRTYGVGKWHLGTGDLIPVKQGFDHFYGFYAGYSNFFPKGIGKKSIKRDAAAANDFVSAYPDKHFAITSEHVSSQKTFPKDYYLTDALGDNAVAFIKHSVKQHADQPFFMYLAFNAPHTPLQAPKKLINKYRNKYSAGWDKMREKKWQRQKELGLIDPAWKLPALRDDIPQWESLTKVQQDLEQHRRAVYAAMIDSVDQNVGKVLKQLADSGIDENTLVVFTSDNGAQAFDNTPNRKVEPSAENSRWSMGPAWAAYSNAPFRYYKQSQHQGGICAPFVARWPAKIAAGTLTDQPGHVVDIMATLVDIADVDYAALKKNDGTAVPPMDGKSLLPIFEGKSRPKPDFWGFEFGNSEFAVIQGDWKLVAFSSSPWRLYNLKDDRTETNNLRWEHPEKVTELAALYDQWGKDTFGNSKRTYANRDTRKQLNQELRYAKVLKGGLYQNPSVDITLSNIGPGAAASMNDHWEFYLTQTSAAGLAGSSDSVTLAHKAMVGDGKLIAQVETMSKMAAKGQAGIMLRATADTGSAMVMLGVTPTGELVQSVRTRSKASLSSDTLAKGLKLPVFLKLKRQGNVFTPSYSADGMTWTDLKPLQLSMPRELLGGVATFSGSTDQRATAIFREWQMGQ
ncbi:arylsulfatase [Verrucomicrobiaceae bacterium 5K15]|uniref:Arylsulfatase n=1 Tax=Oceaniferula flava TaxID=2800421 RepID=A0AAE2SC42_9BACT|nr:sulfatase-like hydrolase/transferase [Oceaniferula flavus]MBK1855143.1 arylsulfatase [Oceaniferula flavus]MBM1136449.1 arylsulfatase [Oceaniferula flavus]